MNFIKLCFVPYFLMFCQFLLYESASLRIDEATESDDNLNAIEEMFRMYVIASFRTSMISHELEHLTPEILKISNPDENSFYMNLYLKDIQNMTLTLKNFRNIDMRVLIDKVHHDLTKLNIRLSRVDFNPFIDKATSKAYIELLECLQEYISSNSTVYNNFHLRRDCVFLLIKYLLLMKNNKKKYKPETLEIACKMINERFSKIFKLVPEKSLIELIKLVNLLLKESLSKRFRKNLLKNNIHFNIDIINENIRNIIIYLAELKSLKGEFENDINASNTKLMFKIMKLYKCEPNELKIYKRMPKKKQFHKLFIVSAFILMILVGILIKK